jgi:cysteinyl-tRNA synthetase
MSKSLGNFTTIRDLLDGKWVGCPHQIDPMAIRLFVLQAHYRKPLDFTEMSITAAENGWQTLKDALRLDWQKIDLTFDRSSGDFDANALDRFQAAMDDDFNTAAGLAVLFELAKYLRKINYTH